MKPLLPSPRAFALAALLTWSFAAYGRHIKGQSAGQPTQASTTAPQILKIDPPNWWATMPRPMLLVRGLNLSAAQVHLSDPNLKIESTQISENGIKATPFTPKPAPPISSEPSTRSRLCSRSVAPIPLFKTEKRKFCIQIAIPSSTSATSELYRARHSGFWSRSTRAPKPKIF